MNNRSTSSLWQHPVYGIIIRRTLEACAAALLCHWLLRWPLTGPHALGLFLTPLLCAYFVFVFVAPWSWGLPIVTRLPIRSQEVVLTFDDGPSPEVTPLILDALHRANVRAAFFVLGEAAERHPALLCRIVAEGHQIGIHSYRHRPFVLLPSRAIQTEVERTRAVILRACPDAPATDWVRPPHGFKSLRLLWLARRERWRLAAWSLDSRDYRESDAGRVAEIVRHGLRPGAIVLLHDGPHQAVTAEALPLILAGLTAQGYGTRLL